MTRNDTELQAWQLVADNAKAGTMAEPLRIRPSSVTTLAQPTSIPKLSRRRQSDTCARTVIATNAAAAAFGNLRSYQVNVTSSLTSALPSAASLRLFTRFTDLAHFHSDPHSPSCSSAYPRIVARFGVGLEYDAGMRTWLVRDDEIRRMPPRDPRTPLDIDFSRDDPWGPVGSMHRRTGRRRGCWWR